MPAKKPPQTAQEVLTDEAKRRDNKLYRQESSEFLDTRIADSVTQTMEEMEKASTMQPVSLVDLERVKELTLRYMESCSTTSTVPSVSGLMRSMGLSRAAFYDVLDRNSPKETAAWFRCVHDAFAELLSNAALRNELNTISSIFLLKSLYRFREQPTELVVSQGNQSPYDGMTSDEAAAAIMQKYQDMVED